MKFNEFTYKNKYINFEKQRIELDKKGIYLVSGDNGVGKTTLMEQIIFGENKVVAATKEQEEAYKNKRANLIAYVPQKVLCPNITVWDYVSKGNKSISQEQVLNYMKKFGMEDISLKFSVKKLSGGERTKLCVISALIKDTPFIFMDEPTNNLDDISVKRLCDVVMDLSKEKTIVMISHDPRVKFQQYNSILISENNIIQTNIIGEENKNMPCKEVYPAMLSLGIKLQGGIRNHIARILFLLLMVAMSVFYYFEFSMNYADESLPDENHILVYQVDCVYTDLNERYAKRAGIKIDEEDYYTMMKYSDIRELHEQDGIEKIYMLDEEYLDRVLQEENLKENEQMVLDIPEVIYNNFMDVIGIADMFSLARGTAPKDNEKEIVMSADMLKNIYGFDNTENILGTMIEVQGEEFKLVGISVYDITWISFCEKKSSLFYVYDITTYKEFEERNLNMKQEDEYLYPFEVDGVIIQTSVGSEKTVLNRVMEQFPANNYDSAVYAEQWIKQYNGEFFEKLLLISVLMSAIGSFIICAINNSVMMEDKYYISDYKNYYIFDQRIKWSYIMAKVFSIILCFSVVWCMNNKIICKAYPDTRGFVLLNGIIIMLPWIMNSILKIQRKE